jgi:hypothetical protein
MVGYRCYILDAEDHILQAREIECEDDTQAKSAAVEDLLARDHYHQSVEVWELARRVARLKRQEAVRYGVPVATTGRAPLSLRWPEPAGA